MGHRYIIKFSKEEHRVQWLRGRNRLAARREKAVTNDDLLAELYKRCPDLFAPANVRRA